jgi:hypothetical protein
MLWTGRKKSSMKKSHRAISLLFSLALFATVFLPGCRKQEDFDNAEYEISKTGPSSWDVAIGKKGMIKVEGFLFPRSAGLEKEYQSTMAIEDEMIAHAIKWKEKAPTLELRESYEEELRLRNEGRWPWRLVDSWPNSQIVIVFGVPTEKTSKVVIVCRPDSKSLDIALTMQSRQDITFHNYLRIAKDIVQQLVQSNADWSGLPVASVPLYDDEGEPLKEEQRPTKFREFYKDMVFPAQH